MAATESEPLRHTPPYEGCLHGEALIERIEEEISRASRQGLPVGCLLVRIDDLQGTVRGAWPDAGMVPDPAGEGLDSERLAELMDRALACVSAALRRQVRRYDRVGRPSPEELLVLLPGADGVRAERVARRFLERLRAIKVEVDGHRRPLRIAVGIAVWRDGLKALDLVKCAREAARRAGEENGAGLASARHS